MFSRRVVFQLALVMLAVFALASASSAQVVRRFAGGGVQINAPFVRVNVGPGGATSVRAPFTAVDTPGRTYIGRRRRLFAQPDNTQPTPDPAAAQQAAVQEPAYEPESVHVDDLPYPTVEQLATMDNAQLVETLREMMARLYYRLSMLNTGQGWQDYLVLSREILGSPGSPPETVQLGAVQKVLPRYQSILDDPQYAKIANFPSFVATFAALQESNQRFAGSADEGLILGTPGGDLPNRVDTPQANQPEVMPTPAVVPNAARGERSILKRK